MAGHDIVVVGGSLGALEVVGGILRALPAKLEASVFVVLHRPAYSDSSLVDVLARDSAMIVRPAADGDAFQQGTVYIAPPDEHLFVKERFMRLTRGPRENHWRPSIDVLFRSAAVAHGSRVIGVILSGALDDGVAGLGAIKQCGGIALVQDPADARAAEMPACAIRNVAVDHVLPAREVAGMIRRIVDEPSGPSSGPSEDLLIEAQIAESGESSITLQDQLGVLTPLTCSECGGPLWRRKGDPLRYRCLTGHALSAKALENGLDQNLDSALWAAIRQFQQKANLQELMALDEEERGRQRTAKLARERAAEARNHAAALRQLLQAAVGGAAAAQTQPETRPM